jgi:hypothetical protein
MLRPVALRPALVVVAVCALAGCGDSGPTDEQQVRATLAEFERAVAARDYRTACERILAPKLIATVEQVGLSCEVALRKGFKDVRDPHLTVGAVAIDDGKATAEVRSSAAGEAPSRDTLELVRVGDRWRIASLGR